MKKRYIYLPLALSLLCACERNSSVASNNDVISQRYIHKYGYAVSKEEWAQKNYPGQVISTLRNGVTITATYENGVLHGPCTHTYPNSQTVQFFYLYNHGNLVKEIAYNALGMPEHEHVQHSPQRYTFTMWYQDGTPMCVEDYANEELLEGEYFTANNETEAKVEKGNGSRICRDANGLLLSKDILENGYMVKKEALYPSGTPKSITHYLMNKLHGENSSFSETGEPISVEEWRNGQLHGKSTYFSSGVKQVELHFLNGAKHGYETHYLDGNTISQQIVWDNNKRHGPTNFYIDGVAHTEWYYDGKKINKKKFDELHRLDLIISQIPEENSNSSR